MADSLYDRMPVEKSDEDWRRIRYSVADKATGTRPGPAGPVPVREDWKDDLDREYGTPAPHDLRPTGGHAGVRRTA